jgi:hypothetical protein
MEIPIGVDWMMLTHRFNVSTEAFERDAEQ